MFTALQIKHAYSIRESHLTWDGFEGLAIMLRHLAYPNRLADLVPMFGRHITELSRIANAIVKSVWEEHGHRLENLESTWIDPEEFAAAIEAKGCPLDNVWGFIDGTLHGMCKPSELQELSGHK